MTISRIKVVLALAASIATAAVFIVLSPFFSTVHANPLGFGCPAYGPSGTASTSLSYMTAGTATTTLTFDTYCVGGSNQPNAGNTDVAAHLALLTQFTASSTSSVLGISTEYSQDGVDWYQDNYIASSTITGGNASYTIQTPNSVSWTYASSTINGVLVTGAMRLGKLIHLYIPTRYVRVVYSMTGAGGAVWGTILPEKERQ